MNRDQIIRKLRRLARDRDVPFDVDQKRGKGSHAILRFAGRKTTCPKGDVKRGTLIRLLADLGLTEADLR